jgi:DNA-binding CsgD family transcriptional regulator
MRRVLQQIRGSLVLSPVHRIENIQKSACIRLAVCKDAADMTDRWTSDRGEMGEVVGSAAPGSCAKESGDTWRASRPRRRASARGAPRNASMVCPPEAGRTETFGVAPWPLMSPLQRCCALVHGALRSEAPDAEAWLLRISASLCAIEPDPVGVACAAVRRVPRPHAPTRWEAEWSAVACSTDALTGAQRVEYKAWIASGFDRDETMDRMIRDDGATTPTCLRRSDVLDDDAWRGSRLARARARWGLYDFVRVVFPYQSVSGRRHFVVQVDGVRGAWRPTACVLERLQGVTPFLFHAFHDRFVLPQVRKRALLERITPAQRLIAPLLAQGLAESEIARRLGRSRHTVHDHTKAIYRAWGVGSRFELRDLWSGASGVDLPPPKRRRG